MKQSHNDLLAVLVANAKDKTLHELSELIGKTYTWTRRFCWVNGVMAKKNPNAIAPQRSRKSIPADGCFDYNSKENQLF